MYVDTKYVYGMAGITSTEVGETAVESAILAAESVVDRLTNTTYWNVEYNGTGSSADATTITDRTANWSTNLYSDSLVWIYSGTGSGQSRFITSNTSTVITVDDSWDTVPDNTSKYRLVHTGTKAFEEELRDGDNTDELFVDNYPLMILQSLTIDSVTVTPANVYQYKKQGRLVLSTDAEASNFPSKKAQLNVINYWYGVYPIVEMVKRLTGIYASLFVLQTQMGTTHNIPSTYSLPEGSCTIGQAYINIKGTWDTLMKNKVYMEELIPKYASFFA